LIGYKRQITTWGSASLIFIHIPDYYDTIAFHCQQATEKYLKAILDFREVGFQKTHNLVYLLELVSRHYPVNEEMFDKAILLNGFSVQIRYPDSKVFLTKEELETAIQISGEFRALAFKIMDIEEKQIGNDQ